MSNPIITYADRFEADKAAPLISISTDNQSTTSVTALSVPSCPIMQLDQFNNCGLAPRLASWTTTGSSLSGIYTLAAGQYIRTVIARGVYPYQKYSLWIKATNPTHQDTSAYNINHALRVSINGVVITAETVITESTTEYATYKYTYTLSVVPYLHILIENCLVGISQTLSLAQLCLLHDGLAYTNETTVDGDKLFNCYETLWLHAPLQYTGIKLIGPSGEEIPQSEFVTQYSSLLYDNVERYHPSRTWSTSPTGKLCAVRVLLRDRLCKAYSDRPLYIEYNRALPTTSGFQVTDKFRELIDQAKLALSPISTRSAESRPIYIKAQDQVKAGICNGGYRFKSTRPKIASIFSPALTTITSTTSTSYPNNLSQKAWITPEAYLQDNPIVSWEVPALIDEVTIQVDPIATARTPYPDNEIRLLREYDIDTGTPEPRFGTFHKDGSLLVSKDSRAIGATGIVGVDGNNGIVKCSTALNDENVWVSYRKANTWWNFDQPYLTGTAGLRRQSFNADTVNDDLVLGMYLYPTYGAIVCSTPRSGSTFADSVFTTPRAVILSQDFTNMVATRETTLVADDSLAVGALAPGTYRYTITAIIPVGGLDREIILNTVAVYELVAPDTSIDLSWDAVTDATSYNIYRYSGTQFSLLTNTANLAYTDDGTIVPNGQIPATDLQRSMLMGAVIDAATGAVTEYFHVLTCWTVGAGNGQFVVSTDTDLSVEYVILFTNFYERAKLVYEYAARTTVHGTAYQFIATDTPVDMFYTGYYSTCKIPALTYRVGAANTIDYTATETKTTGGGMLPELIIPKRLLDQRHPSNTDFTDIARWYGHQYQADSTFVVTVSKPWLDSYITNILALDDASSPDEAMLYARNKIKEVANKYCSYGSYIEIMLTEPHTTIINGYGGHVLDVDYVNAPPRDDFYDIPPTANQTEALTVAGQLAVIFDGSGEMIPDAASTDGGSDIYIISSEVL